MKDRTVAINATSVPTKQAARPFLSINNSQIFQNFPERQPSTKSNPFFKNPFEDPNKTGMAYGILPT